MHVPISPAILYWGTPVVLVTSTNPDDTTNIASISSAFWLGHNCMLGFEAVSQTPQNIQRAKQCVLNLPSTTFSSAKLLNAINVLATTTGTPEVPPGKMARGYRYEHDKWTCTGLTPQSSETVKPHRIEECPVQMECEFVGVHKLLGDEPEKTGLVIAIEVRVLRIHVQEQLRKDGFENRIDSDKWRPMIMSFQDLYGLAEGKLKESTLAKINEEKYRILTERSVKKYRGPPDGSEACEIRDGKDD